MRVIHPGDFKALPKKKKRKSKLPLLLALLVVAAAGYFWYAGRDDAADTEKAASGQSRQADGSEAEKAKTGTLKRFTGEEFKALATSVKYPNTTSFEEPPAITGDKAADTRIRKIAEARGYVLTSHPVTAIEKIHEPRLEGDDLLQPLAAIAWRDLKAAAKREGIPLSLLSAYRSPEYQRTLFMQRLQARGATTASIAAGLSDAAIEAVLIQAAVPGYSRHHTGYTIDLWCEDGSGAFVNSICFRWISANNYKVAKTTGWIPSYPESAELQGPEPEPWEYVWVSRDLVMD